LVRLTGNVELAEDAVQEAVIAALTTWPRTGIPDEPRAWLTVVARRRALDQLRREAARDRKEAQAVALAALDVTDDVPEPTLRDDLLRLIFTCCHPALSLEAQVALSLRTLAGLSTAEVARLLLVPEATMAKRLTRARQKITQAGIPYRVPAAEELPDRLSGVLSTVYVVFTEGYAASRGDSPVRQPLVDEALRLGHLLHELMPDDAGVVGLLALMLLQDARRAARVDEDGRLVLLRDQDRRRWDRELIAEGVVLVGEGLRRTPGRPDPYVVQAAIAACHVLASSWEATDWNALVSWYDVLLRVHDTPVVRGNRAVAIAERDGPAAGLAVLEQLPGLATTPWWHAARGELLRRLGRSDDARRAFASARDLGLNGAHDRWLAERLA
jgi:RNA polymerase sigma-70 factor (ECF subfamily)